MKKQNHSFTQARPEQVLHQEEQVKSEALSNRSINSHLVKSIKKYKKNNKIPNLDLSKVSNEESDEEDQDLDKLIENAIEVELQQNPDIANEFENIEEFKKYIFQK